MQEDKKLFNFMIDRVREVGTIRGLRPPQAFARWFADLYFQSPRDFFHSDGSGDAKVDMFFRLDDGKSVQHCILNTKFTENYNSTAPVGFYDEVTAFWRAFANKSNRPDYLQSIVRADLRQRYKELFKHYDDGRAKLFFVTNCRRNERQSQAVKPADVEVFHLDDVLQFMQDYIEDAMPHTKPLLLTGISTVLSAAPDDTEVPTSIVFARLADFIEYMESDPFELLFARNVRLSLGKTPVNLEILRTFREAPKEFAFSNNGITLLCESLKHEPGRREIEIINPRVVNGSQTLHSIRDAAARPQSARVMLRIIQVPHAKKNDLPEKVARRKDIVHKISIRSNRQNTIKNWDLVSTDDFQHEIARYFRSKKLFYERRRKEWTYRKSELRNLGINRGPDNKLLAQLVASFHWDNQLLGPVTAKRELGNLFDGKLYDELKRAAPELTYQLFLLDGSIRDCVREISQAKDYVRSLRNHMQFVVFSIVARSLDSAGLRWRSPELTSVLESPPERSRTRLKELVATAATTIRDRYYEEAKSYRSLNARDLPLANFFKSQSAVGKLFSKPLSPRLRKQGKLLIEAYGL